MGHGWDEVLQAAIIAGCAWYVRRGAKADSKKVIRETASDSDMVIVKKDLASLTAEFELFKALYFKQNPVIDDRGPSKGK